MIQGFRDLSVWEKGMELACRIYEATGTLPKSETYGLTSQLRRAAVSIPSNIAEGKAIGGQSYPRHLKIAMGSEAELQTQLELARRLGLLDHATVDNLIAQASTTGRMMAALYRSLPKS